METQEQNNNQQKSSNSFWVYGLIALALFFFARKCSCNNESDNNNSVQTEQVGSSWQTSRGDQAKAQRLIELQDMLRKQVEITDQQYRIWQSEGFMPNSSAFYYLKRLKMRIAEICDEMALIGRETGSDSDYQEALRIKQKFMQAFAQMGI